MIKTIIKYGIGCGIAVPLYLNLGYELGMMYREDALRYIVYLGIVIHPLAVLLALWELKKKHYQNNLPLLPAIATGIATSVIAGLLYCLFVYIDIHWLDFRQYKETMEYKAEAMRQQGKTPQEIQITIGQMKARYLSYKPYLATMKWYLKMGAIYTIAAFLLLNIKHFKRKYYDKTKPIENNNSA